MKRMICALLALLLALCPCALAEGDDVKAFPEAGITLHLPEAYLNSRGVVTPMGGTELASNTGLYYLSIYYIAMTEDEVRALDAKADTMTDAEQEALMNAMLPLFSLIAIDGGRDFSDVKALLGDELDEQCVQQVGQAEDVTFYSYIEPMADAGSLSLADEYAALYALNGTVLAAAEYYKPTSPYDAVTGSAVAFETTDIDGNAIDSATLFGAHAYTVVNIWASWCGPCVGEIQELDALNTRLAEYDCAVVGLLYDGNGASALKTAKNILNEKGATYLNILPPANVDSIFLLEAFPTTYIVDRNGTIVGTPVVGVYPEGYESNVMALLGK